MSTNGIDLSNFQAGTSLHGMTGLDFVIAKATEGTTFKDKSYPIFASEAEAAGAQFGAYHFFHAENMNARAQADTFCAYARPRSELSLWVDYETYGKDGQTDAEELALFISEIKLNVGQQQKVGIYCNGTGLARIFPYRAEIPFNGLWYATLDGHVDAQTAKMPWQINQYEVFQGIDRNTSIWTPAQWKSFWAWS